VVVRIRAAICAVSVIASGVAGLSSAAAAWASASSPHLSPPPATRPAAAPGAATAAGEELRAQGYLVPDQAQYQRVKAAAAAGSATPATQSSPYVTKTATKWLGVSQATVAPSDSTGAVGPFRYVELVNDRFGIYDRTVAPPKNLARGALTTFTGDCSGCDVTDPQVIWDPDTNRFYYAVLDFTASLSGTGSNFLLLGFSKSDQPNSAADWCAYSLSFFGLGQFGLRVPDYPKLGDTADFWMIGFNLFDQSANFKSAWVEWLNKPAGTGALTTCPDGSMFHPGSTKLLRPNGAPAFTPVPANQVDGSSTGYVIARPGPAGSSPAANVLLYTVGNSGGSAVFGTATAINVGTYSVPPSAPEGGSSFVIDTLDGRFTQAVAAVDPKCHTGAGGAAVAVWTQHTVAGGAGSEVRWDEINTSTDALCQEGAAGSASLYAYNGAISPDRLVNGSTARFGSNMVLGYNTSSSSSDPAVLMISSVAHAAAGAPVKIAGGVGPYSDGFTCPVAPAGQGLCRWGDYSAATPDPSSALASGIKGRVWLTNAFSAAGAATGGNANWKTENWEAIP
jgi:hypothetical protein